MHYSRFDYWPLSKKVFIYDITCKNYKNRLNIT